MGVTPLLNIMRIVRLFQTICNVWGTRSWYHNFEKNTCIDPYTNYTYISDYILILSWFWSKLVNIFFSIVWSIEFGQIWNSSNIPLILSKLLQIFFKFQLCNFRFLSNFLFIFISDNSPLSIVKWEKWKSMHTPTPF